MPNEIEIKPGMKFYLECEVERKHPERDDLFVCAVDGDLLPGIIQGSTIRAALQRDCEAISDDPPAMKAAFKESFSYEPSFSDEDLAKYGVFIVGWQCAMKHLAECQRRNQEENKS